MGAPGNSLHKHHHRLVSQFEERPEEFSAFTRLRPAEF